MPARRLRRFRSTPKSGSFPAGFGEVTEALYNAWARIANRIEAAKSDQKD